MRKNCLLARGARDVDPARRCRAPALLSTRSRGGCASRRRHGSERKDGDKNHRFAGLIGIPRCLVYGRNRPRRSRAVVHGSVQLT
jgi:hypothetical protein